MYIYIYIYTYDLLCKYVYAFIWVCRRISVCTEFCNLAGFFLRDRSANVSFKRVLQDKKTKKKKYTAMGSAPLSIVRLARFDSQMLEAYGRLRLVGEKAI